MPLKGTRSKAKSKAAEPEIFDAEPDMNEQGERETTTAASEPTRRRSKRKAAAQDEESGVDHDQDAAAANKKPKVAVHTTQVDIVSSSGTPTQHQTHRNVKLDIPLSSIMTTTKPTGKRIVFNDDDDHKDYDAAAVSPDGTNEFFTPQGSPTTAMPTSAQQLKGSHDKEDEEDEDDSDDDAPEAVSTHTAAAQAAKSAQAAAHAAGRQREAERQRRQERDARLKAQAGSRKKQPQVKDESESEAEEEKKKEARITPSAAKPTRRFTKNNLPDVLPEEFLASDSENDDDNEEEGKRNIRKPTVIKFNTVARQVAKAESRQPADQRVGSTVYRVMKKKRDETLAPKGTKYSRNAREGLLGRRRPGPRNRTTKGGFLVKR